MIYEVFFCLFRYEFYEKAKSAFSKYVFYFISKSAVILSLLRQYILSNDIRQVCKKKKKGP